MDSDEDVRYVPYNKTQREGSLLRRGDALFVHSEVLFFADRPSIPASPASSWCSYQRSNKDRCYYESLEVAQAGQWASQLAVRRATQAAQRAQRDPRKEATEESFSAFVDDPDLFRRGVENHVLFHARKMGRWAGQPGPVPTYITDPDYASKGASSASSSSSSAAMTSSSASASSKKGGAPSQADHHAEWPAGAGDAPGSFHNPSRHTARQAYHEWAKHQANGGTASAGSSPTAPTLPASVPKRSAAKVAGKKAAAPASSEADSSTDSDSDDDDGSSDGDSSSSSSDDDDSDTDDDEEETQPSNYRGRRGSAPAQPQVAARRRPAPSAPTPPPAPAPASGLRSVLASASSFLSTFSGSRPSSAPAAPAPAPSSWAASSKPGSSVASASAGVHTHSSSSSSSAAAAAPAPATTQPIISRKEAAAAARAAADAAGTDVFLRLRLGGELLHPPLKARVSSALVPPPKGTHRRTCRLCAPSLLEGPVVGRKGTDEAGGSLASLSRHHHHHHSRRLSDGGGGAASSSATKRAGSAAASSASASSTAVPAARKRGGSASAINSSGSPAPGSPSAPHSHAHRASAAAAAAAAAALQEVLVPTYRVLSTAHLHGLAQEAAVGAGFAARGRAGKAASKAAAGGGRGQLPSPPQLDMAMVKSSAAAGGSSSSSLFTPLHPAASPAIIFGLDSARAGAAAGKGFSAGGAGSASRPASRGEDLSGNKTYVKLAKLSKELGSAIAVDRSRLVKGPADAAAQGAGAAPATTSEAGAARGMRNHHRPPGGGGGSSAGSGSASSSGSGSASASKAKPPLSKTPKRGGAAPPYAVMELEEDGGGDEDDAEEDGGETDVDMGGLGLGVSHAGPRAGMTSDPSLDRQGYDAGISRAFWEAYTGRSASINAHADSVPTLVRDAARRKRISYVGAPPTAAEAAAATSLGASAASDGVGAGASSSSSGSSSAPLPYGWGQGEPVITDGWRFEKWLIRRRLHHCETHGSDTGKASPIVEWFSASSAPYAGLLLQLVAEERERERQDEGGAVGGGAGADGSRRHRAGSGGDGPGSAPGSASKAKGGSGGAGASSMATPAGKAAASGAAFVASAIMNRGGVIPPSIAPSLAAFTGDSTSKLVAAASAAKPNRVHGRKRKRIYAGEESDDDTGADDAMAAAALAFSQAFCPAQLGCMLDVKDSSGQWWLGQVIDVGDGEEAGSGSGKGAKASSSSSSASSAAASGPPAPASHVLIHYQGWPEEYDEWVPLPSQEVLDAILAEAKVGVKPPPGPAGAPPTPAPKMTPALRAAIGASRIAPPLTRSELLSSTCAACGNKKAGQLVFCDAPGCGKAFHMACHKPAVTKVPTGRWVCSAHG